jgi:hydroxyacylglutathione hydrolase
MLFRQIWDQKLAQYAYLIGCQATGEAIIIDPERDIDRYVAIANQEGLKIVAAADTHIHADYLTGLREFAETDVHVYASDAGDADWKYDWLIDSSYSYTLLVHGDSFNVGNIQFTTIHSPGHTPEHVSFLVTDLGGGADQPMGILTGDFVFVGDLGRPDLLESAAGIEGAADVSARALYQSVQDFLRLDDFLQVWPAHGAGSSCGKALGAIPQSTVGYERAFNGAIGSALRGEVEFISAILDGQPEPPMYFARMKHDNRNGPRVLGNLPEPRSLTEQDLANLSGKTDVVVLDTRLDRSAYMASHLPGSLYAPFNKSFNTTAGSIVEENVPIYLIIEEEYVEEAVRDLIRIGLDTIEGFASPHVLESYASSGAEMATIREIGFEQVDELIETHNDVVVLDVRNQAEYQAAHMPNSKNIAHTRLYVRQGEIPPGTKLVHCAGGGRAAIASSLLARLGHNVIFVSGSFAAWSARSDHVVVNGQLIDS